MNWYVVHCHTGKEEEVGNKIKGKDIAQAVVVLERVMKERYKGKWVMAKRVVFPGYVFVQATMTPDAYYDMHVPGVIRVLGKPRPMPLMDDEVTYLIRMGAIGPIGMSEVLDEGGKITVISGPLKGLEGNIKTLDRRRFRARVNISIMGEPRVVELAVNVIKKS